MINSKLQVGQERVNSALNSKHAESSIPLPEQEFYLDVVAGLSGNPKTLPSKYFYDQRGSELFEQICELDEYYLTRAELSILDEVAQDIARLIPDLHQIVEFGSGNCEKVQYLLDRHAGVRGYVPIDVSREFLLHHAERLMDKYANLDVFPMVGDFTQPLKLGINQGIRMGFFPGSTIGNLTQAEAVSFLRNAATSLGENSYFLVGVDTVKSEDILLAAYDDAQGVTRDFNLNLLHRIQSQLGATVTVEQFSHEARFNHRDSRIEMHLRSRCDQQIHINGDTFNFVGGETIHTENSHKYTIDAFQQLARQGGWEPYHLWLSTEDMFSVHLLKRQI